MNDIDITKIFNNNDTRYYFQNKEGNELLTFIQDINFIGNNKCHKIIITEALTADGLKRVQNNLNKTIMILVKHYDELVLEYFGTIKKYETFKNSEVDSIKWIVELNL